MNSWIYEGAPVAYHSGYAGTSLIKKTIDKVYRTGNFTLEGSKQQWHPGLSGAYETGTSISRYRAYICAWTPELEKEIAEREVNSRLRERWDRAVEPIEETLKFRNFVPSESALRLAENLARLLQPDFSGEEK